MRFLRQNTAVIITVGPFYDKTDGVTIETGLTITNEKITLTADTDDGSAPTNILDNVTGATSGTDNDLNYISGNDAGIMQLELSAANTNRVGRMFLSITDAANHVPVFHEFMVLPGVIYDAFVLGTDALTADVDTIKGQTVTCAAGVTVLASVGTAATSTAQTGDAYGRLGAPAGASVSADIAAVKSDAAAILLDTGTDGVVLPQAQADKVWGTAARVLTAATNITSTGGTTVPQTGDSYALANGASGFVAIKGVADDILTDTGTTLDGKVDSILEDTGTTLDGKIDTIDGNVDSILADTGTDGVVVAAGSKTGYALSSAGIDAVWDQASSLTLSFEALLTRAYQMVNNKMTVNESNGNVALRDIGDTGDIATGNVASNSGTTTRAELTWS